MKEKKEESKIFQRWLPRWFDYLTAILVTIFYTSLLVATDDIGFTRDESFYFHAAHEYAGWFEDLETNLSEEQVWASFEQGNIDQHWAYNPEHPVLVKALFSLSFRYFHVKSEIMSESLSIRFPAMVFGGLLLAFVFLLTYEFFGSRFGAWIAVLCMAAMPHYFFHAHLASFDVPMTTMWIAVVYAYWRSLHSNGWAWTTGLFWGLALITKLNAFFIPFVFLGHWGIRALSKFRFKKPFYIKVPPLPFALFTMLLVGPVIFYLGWPRHWFDTFNRIGWYLNFHLSHEHYFVYFFGENLYAPPFPVYYPFVMTAITTPIGILGLMLFGSVVFTFDQIQAWRKGIRDRDGRWVLLVLNIGLAYLIIARPSTPIFGGIKHWFTALPYLATLAGYGAVWIVKAIHNWLQKSFPKESRIGFFASRWISAVSASILAGAITWPAIIAVQNSHPYGISYYNTFIGGYTGAADHRAMRQFWGYASKGALQWLNMHAPYRAKIAFHNSTNGSYDMYIEDKYLRNDLRYAWNVENADYLVYHHQRASAFEEYNVWPRFDTVSPSYVVAIAGVPLISVYPNLRRVDGRALGVEPRFIEPSEEEQYEETNNESEELFDEQEFEVENVSDENALLPIAPTIPAAFPPSPVNNFRINRMDRPFRNNSQSPSSDD